MLEKLKNWLSDHRPVFKKTMRDAVQTVQNLRDQDVDDLNNRLKKMRAEMVVGIGKERESVSAIIERLTDVRYDKHDDCYSVCVSFSPRMFAGCYQEEQRIIAERVARKIEHEISTCKFVQKSYENEVRMEQRTTLPWKQAVDKFYPPPTPNT